MSRNSNAALATPKHTNVYLVQRNTQTHTHTQERGKQMGVRQKPKRKTRMTNGGQSNAGGIFSLRVLNPESLGFRRVSFANPVRTPD